MNFAARLRHSYYGDSSIEVSVEHLYTSMMDALSRAKPAIIAAARNGEQRFAIMRFYSGEDLSHFDKALNIIQHYEGLTFSLNKSRVVFVDWSG